MKINSFFLRKKSCKRAVKARDRVCLNQNGFSLLEIMVAVGLLSILTFAFLNLSTNALKQEKTMQNLFDARVLQDRMNEISRTPQCGISALMLRPIEVSSDSFINNQKINLSEGLVSRFLNLKQGDKYGDFLVESVEISPFRNISTNALEYIALDGDHKDDFANATRIKANLSVSLKASGLSKAPLLTDINLILSADKKTIVSCFSGFGESHLEAACDAFGGHWNEQEFKCKLPCPPGLDDYNGICVISDQQADSCSVNNRCNVLDKYVL